MKISRKKLILITPIIICGVFCLTTLTGSAIRREPNFHHGCRQSLLQQSVHKLKANGVLTEEDMKNIDKYMNKDREAKEKEIKEKIYNSECKKIDNMVDEKVITQEKGNKIKDAMKENLQ